MRHPLAFTTAAAFGLLASAASALQALRLARAVRVAHALRRRAQPFQTRPAHPHAHVLVVGDSTGVGIGAGNDAQSLPGLLALRYPGVAITNRSANGARIADALAQVNASAARGERHDLLLVFAGGNDVLALTPNRKLVADARRLLDAASRVAARVVWLGHADIGCAPVIAPPLAWCASWLTRRNARALARTVRRKGAAFVDFSERRFSNVFGRATQRWFAADGLHPSADAYRFCLDEVERRVPLAAVLRQEPALPVEAEPFRVGRVSHPESSTMNLPLPIPAAGPAVAAAAQTASTTTTTSGDVPSPAEALAASTTRPLAIVTGASSGIGLELARLASRHGFDLLVAADEPSIDTVATELRADGTEVTPLCADLATTDGVDALVATASGRPVDVLFANAGHGLGHAFLDQDFADVRHVIDTNITGTLDLIQRIGNQMRARGEGRILITGSIAGFTPGTFSAVYNGTKAFIDSFGAALRNELKHSGVSVTVLMPGATETNFFARADMLDTKLGQGEKDDPADVAKAGFDAVMKGDDRVIVGMGNKLQVAAANVVPDTVLAEKHRDKAEPGSADKPD